MSGSDVVVLSRWSVARGVRAAQVCSLWRSSAALGWVADQCLVDAHRRADERAVDRRLGHSPHEPSLEVIQLEGGVRHFVDEASVRVGVVHRRAVGDDEQKARVDARHRDLRRPAGKVRPEDISDLDGLTAHPTSIGRHTEFGRHLRRNRRQGVIGENDVELREVVAHPLDHVRTRSIVDAARVHHRHPQVVEAGLGDGDQVLVAVPPAGEDVAVGAVGEVHHLPLRVDDVAQSVRRSADREHVTGLKHGAPAHRHGRVDVGVEPGIDDRVGVGARRIRAVVGVGRAATATSGKQTRDGENGGAEEVHGDSSRT